MGSCAALAETPSRVEKLIEKSTDSENKAYGIYLYLLGEKVRITVDDFIPLTSWKAFALAHSKTNEMWISLLEKAMAKMHGRYECIEAGQLITGLRAVTGAPAVYHDHDKTQDLFGKIMEAE